jgi:hypothetical protein
MTSFKTLAFAALLSITVPFSVFAQAAIQEPGAFAFYHPDRDVLNSGAPANGYASGLSAAANAYASVEGDSASSCALRYRSYDPASGTFRGRDGRRNPCQ